MNAASQECLRYSPWYQQLLSRMRISRISCQNVFHRAFVSRKTLLCSVVVVTSLIALAIPSVAGSLSASVQATETMMNTSGIDSFSFVEEFGVDPSAILQYSSFTDPRTGAFSYSLLPGQTYLGKPISLTTTGKYDASTTTYSWQMVGDYGGQDLAGYGTAYWFGDPTETVDQWDKEGKSDLGNTIWYHYKGNVDVNTTDQTSTFKGLKLSIQNGPLNGRDESLSGKDTYTITNGVKTFKWTVTDAKEVSLNESGTEPFDGGFGSFSIRATPTPEPSALLMFGSGILGVAGVLRRRLGTRI